MQPTQTTNTPFNDGKPLSPDQIKELRGKIGITQSAGNSTPADSSDVASQWAKFTALQTPKPQQGTGLEGKLQADDTGYFSGMGARTGQEQVTGAKKIASSVKMGSEDMQKGYELSQTGKPLDTLKSAGKYAQGALEGGVGTITGAARAALAPITAAVEPLIPSGETIVDRFKAGHPILGTAIDALSPVVQEQIIPKLQEFAQKHPNATTLFGDVLSTVLLAVGGGEAEAPVKEALTKDALGSTADNIANSTVSNPLKGTPKVNDLESLAQKISPKPTPNEVKLATEQGRLYKGKEGTMFNKGTPDRIATSDAQLKQVQTINKYVPDHAKLDEPTLYQELKKNVSTISEKLKPELQKTPVNRATVTKMADDWKEIKANQLKKARATEEPNVAKRQSDFESIIKKVAGNSKGNMNDLWEAAKQYDASIDTSVKKANEMSSRSLLDEKNEWLQNRKILKDAINSEQNGLGETSRQAFSDMTDLYESQNGILSKAELNTEAEPSKIQGAVNSLIGKAARKMGPGVEAVRKLVQ